MQSVIFTSRGAVKKTVRENMPTQLYIKTNVIIRSYRTIGDCKCLVVLVECNGQLGAHMLRQRGHQLYDTWHHQLNVLQVLKNTVCSVLLNRSNLVDRWPNAGRQLAACNRNQAK